MAPEVRVSDFAASKISATYGPERSTTGWPSEWDFWSGPLAAALVGFRDFDNLLWHSNPDVRSLHIVDPIFGALVFVGVLVEPGTIVIDDVEVDPDYWTMIENDPND